MFENMWTNHVQFLPLIQQCWQHTDDASHTTFMSKIGSTKVQLRQWRKKVFQSVPQCIREVKEDSLHIQSLPPNADTLSQEIHLQSSLDLLLKYEEIWWRRRAKTKWILEGDKNTSFFAYFCITSQAKEHHFTSPK